MRISRLLVRGADGAYKGAKRLGRGFVKGGRRLREEMKQTEMAADAKVVLAKAKAGLSALVEDEDEKVESKSDTDNQ